MQFGSIFIHSKVQSQLNLLKSSHFLFRTAGQGRNLKASVLRECSEEDLNFTFWRLGADFHDRMDYLIQRKLRESNCSIYTMRGFQCSCNLGSF